MLLNEVYTNWSGVEDLDLDEIDSTVDSDLQGALARSSN